MYKQLLINQSGKSIILTYKQIKNLHIVSLNLQKHYYSHKKSIILFKLINVTNKIDKVQRKSDKMQIIIFK